MSEEEVSTVETRLIGQPSSPPRPSSQAASVPDEGPADVFKRSPRITAVVAVDKEWGIGRNNQLMWSLPNDLKHFKSMTIGRPVVMGRKTFESMGRPLPSRTNIIITRDDQYQAAGCVIVPSIEKALEAVPDAPEVAIIGGGEIFRQTLPMVDTVHLTEVHHRFGADVFFPVLSPKDWRETSRQHNEPDEKHAHSYDFITLERVKP